MRYAVLLLLLSIVACKPKESLTEKVFSHHFFERIEKDSLLPGFKLEARPLVLTELDTLFDTIIKIDPTTGAELRIWKNRFGELQITCSKQSELITKLRERITQLEAKESEAVIIKKPTWWQRALSYFKSFWWIVVVIAFVVLVLFFVKRIEPFLP